MAPIAGQLRSLLMTSVLSGSPILKVDGRKELGHIKSSSNQLSGACARVASTTIVNSGVKLVSLLGLYSRSLDNVVSFNVGAL